MARNAPAKTGRSPSTKDQAAAPADAQPPRPGGLRGLAEDAIHRPETRAYQNFLKVVLVAILGSITVLALETVHPLSDDYAGLFHAIDLVLLVIFTAEYLLNLWVAPSKRAYVLSLWGIVDFLAIAPAYVEMILGGVASLVFLRQLRILRVMRMLKLMKLAAEQAAASAAKATEKQNTFLMDIQIYLICLFTVLTISSSLLFAFEGVGAHVPELTADALSAISTAEEEGKAPPEWAEDVMVQLYSERAGKGWSVPVYTYTSVPKAYWWSIVTLTTTGYGDMFPVTTGGRIVGGATMLAGLGLFSLLTSVVGRALMTSLFGSGDDDATPRSKVVVIGGGRLPPGTDLKALLATADGASSSDAGNGDASAARADRHERGALEGAFLESEVTLHDLAQSATQVGREVLMASVSTSSDGSASSRRRGTSPIDHFIYDAFADPTSRLFMPMQQFLTGLIFVSVVLVVADSIHEVHEGYHVFFEWLEKLIVLCFTFEFVANYRLAPNKKKYVFSVWGMIDLLAIMPTYIDMGIGLLALFGIEAHAGGGLLLKILRMLRVLRVLRTLKLAKSATANMEKAMSKGGSSFWSDFQIYLIALFTVLIIASTLMWNLEFDPTDEASTTPFINIPVSMWWGIVTLCTVGYGDMFPITTAGRAVAGATMLAGLALFGILTSVIGRALMASLFGSDETEPEPEVVYIGASGRDDRPVIGDLERLVLLKDAGALSDEEFERAKAIALRSG